jgi:spore coat protein U-like protein
MRRGCWLGMLALLLAGAFWSPDANAAAVIECSATAPAAQITFANTPDNTVDGTNPNNISSSLTYTVSCTNYGSAKPVSGVVCFGIGIGPHGLAGGNRQIQSSSGDLQPFQLYTDAAHTRVWGGPAGGPAPGGWKQIPFSNLAYVKKKVIGTVTVYAMLFMPLVGASPGAYNASFGGFYSDAPATGEVGTDITDNPCTHNDVRNNIGWNNGFSVTMTVSNTGHLSATDLDFGNTIGVFTSNLSATSQIIMQCPNDTFNIGLDDGQHYSNGTRHMRSPNGKLIAYQLYRNSARNQPWGDIIDTNTLSGTCDGKANSYTVYGRVPAGQASQPIGDYSDIITVTLTN